MHLFFWNCIKKDNNLKLNVKKITQIKNNEDIRTDMSPGLGWSSSTWIPHGVRELSNTSTRYHFTLSAPDAAEEEGSSLCPGHITKWQPLWNKAFQCHIKITLLPGDPAILLCGIHQRSEQMELISTLRPGHECLSSVNTVSRHSEDP